MGDNPLQPSKSTSRFKEKPGAPLLDLEPDVQSSWDSDWGVDPFRSSTGRQDFERVELHKQADISSDMQFDEDEDETIYQREEEVSLLPVVDFSNLSSNSQSRFYIRPSDGNPEAAQYPPSHSLFSSRLEQQQPSSNAAASRKLGLSSLSSGSSRWRGKASVDHSRSGGRGNDQSTISEGFPYQSSSTSFEMRSRNTQQPLPNNHLDLNPSFVLVDVPIEAADTLPSFAIRYHVTIAELKRLNGLFHDQDFYSRQSLRVPIHKYGILAERFLRAPNFNQYDSGEGSSSRSTAVLVDLASHSNSPVTLVDRTDEIDVLKDNENPDEVMRSISLRSVLDSQSREAKLFLQNMDRDLTRLTQEALQRTVSAPVEDSPLAQRERIRVEPLDGLGCDGADLGIPVKVIILMALILTVVLPAAFLVYKFYCYHHPESCPDGVDPEHHIPRNGSS